MLDGIIFLFTDTRIGLQSAYLAEVGRPFAAALFRLIGGEANKVADVAKES